MTKVLETNVRTEPKAKIKKPKLKVPQVFDYESEEYCKYCLLGTYVGWCMACYLGDKFKVKNSFLVFLEKLC